MLQTFDLGAAMDPEAIHHGIAQRYADIVIVEMSQTADQQHQVIGKAMRGHFEHATADNSLLRRVGGDRSTKCAARHNCGSAPRPTGSSQPTQYVNAQTALRV